MDLSKKIELQINRLVASYPEETTITALIVELERMQILREQIKIHPIGLPDQLLRKDIGQLQFNYEDGELKEIIFEIKLKEKLNSLIQSFAFNEPLSTIIQALEKLGISKEQINVIPGGSIKQFTQKDLEPLSDLDILFFKNGKFHQLILRLKTQNWIQELINSYPLDISSEVIVAELVEQGVPFEKINLHPKGTFKRFYNKDIADVNFEFDEMGDLAHIGIGVNREGIYDSLPEILFHQQAERKPFKSKEQMIKESERLHEEEVASRTFFQPIEEAIYNQRIRLELTERESIRNSSSEEIKAFWDLPDFIEEEQVTTLLYLLPIATRLVGKSELVALCLRSILKEEVKIMVNNGSKSKEQEEELKEVMESSVMALGDCVLGSSMVMDGQFEDGIPTVTLKVGPVDPKDIKTILPGGTKNLLIDWVKDYFFPVEWEVETNILINNNDFRPFELNNPKYALGYSMVI